MARSASRRYIAASELAQMGFCEHKALLERQRGKLTTDAQQRSIERGNTAHARFHHDAMAVGRNGSSAKPWCFVATEVFGQNAVETMALRCFRDEVLRQNRVGRLAIVLYYRWSPLLAASLRGVPGGTRIARTLLRCVVWCLRLQRTALERSE
jgi:hypothetical protein